MLAEIFPPLDAVRWKRPSANFDGCTADPESTGWPVPLAYNFRVAAPDLEGQLRAFFDDHSCNALAVYLFGSVARGTACATSDIDLGILYEEAPARTMEGLPLSLESELERIVGRPVQIVVLNHAPADLIHRVLRDGKLLLDRDRSARIRFEVKARNEFFDLEGVRQRYRKPRVAASRL